MRMQCCYAVLCALSVLATTGCDFSGGGSSTTQGGGVISPGPIGGGGGGFLENPPILLDMQIVGEGVCVGDEVTLVGLNFSSDLAANEVIFTSGTTSIEGLPLQVSFPSDGNSDNGLESNLVVLVPSGVATGNLELRVAGIPAGARGYTACPQIMAVTIGVNRDQEAIPHLGPLGFVDGQSFIELHGLNFNELREVLLQDSLGNVQRIPTNTITRTQQPTGFNPNAPPPTGYSSMGFNLKDDRNDVRLSFPQTRDNLSVTITGPGGQSNTVQVPVINGQDPNLLSGNPDALGIVINGVKLPTGVRTGPVRIRYSIYDGQVASAWFINVDWRLVGEPDDAWRRCKPATDDPLHDGIRGILPGTLAHPSGSRLFPGGGTVRTFSWDAPNDANFCILNETQGGDTTRRDWAVEFRIMPELDIADANRQVNEDHEWITPPILYYYMEALPGDTNVLTRSERTFRENFLTSSREDLLKTTASWGPPANLGALVGGFPPPGTPSMDFGEGTARVVLRNRAVPTDNDQWWLINTDRMTIVYNQFDPGPDPAVPDDDSTVVDPFVVDNPGEDVNEFHFESFEIEPGVRVIVTGSHPLVMRLSGRDGASATEPVFICDGILDCNGPPGESTPINGNYVIPNPSIAGVGGGAKGLTSTSGPTRGPGGAVAPGGGVGGNGGSMVLGNPTLNARITQLRLATAGSNDGGGGGETTGAVEFVPDAASSFWGAPGGGGGHLREGGTGDPQHPKPAEYQPPKGGRGGVARGEAEQLVQTPGSGGGGGGATVTRVTMPLTYHVAMGGAGGGGGGGMVKIVANGTVRVITTELLDPATQETLTTGYIAANGGQGGSSAGDRADLQGQALPPITAGGAGGGGSGGSIVIQAAGAVQTTCDSLQVQGGPPGLSGRVSGGDIRNDQNIAAGSGFGSPGYVRIESLMGGAPSCVALQASAVSTACLRADETMIVLDSAAGFPDSGMIVVTGQLSETSRTGNCTTPLDVTVVEEMFYFGVDGDMLTGALRGLNGTVPVTFSPGAEILLVGAVAPFDQDVLSQGEIVVSPDPVEPGQGRDGELHVRFIPSVDPATGSVLRDPETDEVLSIWTFDTDLGVVQDPNGDIVVEVRAIETNPGLLDLTRLQIDDNTTLRGRGSNPMLISVSGEADIAGTIDVSGFRGGELRFRGDNVRNPRPGLGGASGPGGGAGGAGGTIVYQNGEITDKSPENTSPINGEPGALPAGVPLSWDKTPAPYGNGANAGEIVVFPGVTRATPGASIRGQPCDSPPDNPESCDNTAGGGAGGGSNGAGDNGNDPNTIAGRKVFFEPLSTVLPGEGGSNFGTDTFRFDGDLWTFGGTGGSGGGASSQVSAAYKLGILPRGSVLFTGALHAPGTGGGGGGGVLVLTVNNLSLRPEARLVSRGGNAIRSIDLGGNGGAGAGGTVILRVASTLTIAQGALIDVSGGIANGDVPIDPGQGLPLYEGNFHRSNTGEFGFFGGVGGNGAPGRILIEADRNSQAAEDGLNISFSSGQFLEDTYGTIGVSVAVLLGVGPGNSVSAPNLALSGGVVRYHDFGQPLGTDSSVLWEGATESLDVHGQPGKFLQAVRDPRDLRFTEYVRFSVPFRSNASSRETQSIREILMLYRYPANETIGCGL